MASNIRVLVSNLGDGNWGVGTDESNKLNNATSEIFFPPGATKGAAPSLPAGLTEGLSPAAQSADLIGFTSKTQWMVQVNVINFGTAGAGAETVSVFAVRPTGIEDLIHTFSTAGQDSYGGVTTASEGPIEGPVSYFKFKSNAGTTTNLDVDCYVIGWNYGDISDGIGTR